ncbi:MULTISPECIES: hypothetical protein [unclassified Exiguobacterium]|uniref:hypothetical protein n=1 Tax=unclassified Exiguobacterium TaxID=2644629 RepID=UPI0007D79868|nr:MULTISPECIES: hypothetical protein [unclassified Exiguobacterium]OAI82746.1 hypothetical protein AYO36_14855 [Exiguobacterium sp. KKBO11]
MSKYHLSSIRLVLIVVITSSILYFGFDWELGYGIIFLIVTVGYTIYLNFKSAQIEKAEAETKND